VAYSLTDNIRDGATICYVTYQEMHNAPRDWREYCSLYTLMQVPDAIRAVGMHAHFVFRHHQLKPKIDAFQLQSTIMPRNTHSIAILGPELAAKLPQIRVLMVGAGGIGCELRKFECGELDEQSYVHKPSLRFKSKTLSLRALVTSHFLTWTP
jgi:hypothetical protein